MSKNFDKTKEQLIAELAELRKEGKERQDKLNASNQQMDAQNQQLQASEQQLRAANQQLEANNQQLRAAEERQRRLATVVTDSNDAITVQDLDGTITAWNRGAEQMYGWTEDEALGMNIRDTVPEEWREQALGFVEQLKKGEEVKSLETKRTTKDGRELDVWMTVTKLVDESDKLTGLATTERDITERKREEKKLKAANQQMDAQNQQLQASEQQLRAANQQLEANNQQLRASEERQRRLATVVTDSNDAITVQDLDGTITAWNRGAEQMYGWTEDEALGMNIRDTVAEEWREQALGFVEQLKKGEEVKSLETKRTTKDGRELDVWMTVTKLVDESDKLTGLATTERDITERKQEEKIQTFNRELEERVRKRTAELADANQQLDAQNQQLQATEQQLRTTNQQLEANNQQLRAIEKEVSVAYDSLNSSISGVIITNREGEISYCNPTFLRMFEYKNREEVTGKYARNLFLSEKVQKFTDVAAIIDQTKGETEQFPARRKDGTEFPVEVTSSIVTDQEGNNAGRMASFIDITERKQAEEELTETNKLLEAATAKANSIAAEAEKATAAKSEFLANMSHEIRTPLNAVMGMGQLLADTPLNNHQRDYLAKIDRSSKLLLGIINDVLDISKIEAGKLELDPHSFYLYDVMNDIRTMFTGKVQKKGLELIVKADVNLPRALVGDSMRLGQVITNLLGNALKFTESGHVSLQINKAGEAASSPDSSRLTFSVKDSGIGMNEEQMGRLFNPFSQADSSTTRKYGGTGLGLVISSRLVEAMGGTLEVTSVEGEGSTFFFTIELPKSSHHTGIADRPVLLLDNTKFLVVDDQEAARIVLREIVESWNCDVVEAAGGTEAVEEVLAAQEQNTHFDFILMDWRMPGEMDGLATIRHLKHLHETGTLTGDETPIFIVSGYDENDIPPSEAYLYEAFLGKPVIASVLFDAIMLATSGELTIVQQTDSTVTPSFAGYTILLVEDNELNQEVATGFITKTTAKVITAENGTVALQCYEENNIDMVLMDLQMPVMDGFDATAEIRRRERASNDDTHIPIIALSAAVMDVDRKKAAKAGADGHLGKPIDLQELYTVMGQYMKSSGTISGEPVSTEEVAEEFPVLDGFDLARGKASAQGNRDTYMKLLRSFYTKITGAFADFPDRIISLTFEEIQFEAHTIRGVAATVGALRVADAAAVIDKTSTEQTAPTESMVNELREALLAAKEQIAPHLSIEKSTVAVDEEEGRKAMDTLLEILRNSELPEDDLIETVVAFVEAQAGSEKADALRSSIEQFDMDTAVNFLEKFEKGE